MIVIEHVEPTKLKAFIDCPHDVLDGYANYVPMIYMEQEALLNPKKSPFWKHSKAAYFVAKRNGKVVGRIAAIRNNNHIGFTGRMEGHFGFFDVENNYDTAKLLLDKATEWLKSEGLTKVIGPSNFSTNETVGVILDNFDEPPFIMNVFTPPYYKEFLERYGMVKHVDLNCYELVTAEMPQKILDLGERLEQRLANQGITFRKINMKNFTEEIAKFLPVYNESWSENTGFVPMTDAEIAQIGKDMKPILDPDFILFAEKDGKVVGVSLTVPNINEIQINIKRGRLFPFNFLKILFGLKSIKSLRVIALGTLIEYRKKGIDAVFYIRNIKLAQQKGIIRSEASWILEHNTMMNKALEDINGRIYRKYRLYEKDI